MAYTPEQLSDIECIRDATKHYCRGVDRLDPDEMKKAYWPDAIDHHGTFVGNAWEFVDFCMKGHLRWRATMHCIYNHSIELSDDPSRATGEIYNVTYLFRDHEEDDRAIDVWYGRYIDDYEKRDGEWRIRERICVYEGSKVDSVDRNMGLGTDEFRQGSFDRNVQST